jgi:hypothetical protein
MILVAERLAFIDVQDLAHIALGMSPDKLMAPRLINDVTLIRHIA